MYTNYVELMFELVNCDLAGIIVLVDGAIPLVVPFRLIIPVPTSTTIGSLLGPLC